MKRLWLSGALIMLGGLMLAACGDAPTNARRLPAIAQTALNIAGKLKHHRKPRWFIGFDVQITTKKGPARGSLIHQRFTHYDGSAQM